jgi:hypothetical protein
MRRLVNEDELPLLGISLTEAHEALRAGAFPLPSTNVRPGRITWWRDEIDTYLLQRVTAPRFIARCG